MKFEVVIHEVLKDERKERAKTEEKEEEK